MVAKLSSRFKLCIAVLVLCAIPAQQLAQLPAKAQAVALRQAGTRFACNNNLIAGNYLTIKPGHSRLLVRLPKPSDPIIIML